MPRASKRIRGEAPSPASTPSKGATQSVRSLLAAAVPLLEELTKTVRKKRTKSNTSDGKDGAPSSSVGSRKRGRSKAVVDASKESAKKRYRKEAELEDESVSITTTTTSKNKNKKSTDGKFVKRSHKKNKSEKFSSLNDAYVDFGNVGNKGRKTHSGDKPTGSIGGRPRRGNPRGNTRPVPEGGAVLYVGHLPHGFYEKELSGFFSQFGKVGRVVVSRSRKTGASRGYGWVEFAEESVCRIAGASMQGYLLDGKTLRTRVHPAEECDAEWFKPARHRKDGNIGRFSLRQPVAAERKRHYIAVGEGRSDQHIKKRAARERSKRARLIAAGIKYSWDGLNGGRSDMSAASLKQVVEDKRKKILPARKAKK